MKNTQQTGLVLRGNAPQITLASGSEAARDSLIARLDRIKRVSSTAELALATEAIREAKALLRSVEVSRKAVKAPLTAVTRQVDEIAAVFANPLEASLAKRQDLVDEYVTEQERARVAAEAAARAEAARIEQERAAAAAAAEAKLAADLAKAKTEAARTRALERAEDRQQQAADAAASAYAELPVAQRMAKPEGVAVRTVKQFEVLDITALYQARPDLVDLCPNGPAIRVALRAGLQGAPGLRVWEETSAVVRQ